MAHMLAGIQGVGNKVLTGYTVHGYMFCLPAELGGRTQQLIREMQRAARERRLNVREPGLLTKIDDVSAKFVRDVLERNVPLSGLKMIAADDNYYAIWLMRNGVEDNEALLKLH